MFNTEYFGPILAVHVYEDGDFEKVVAQMESFAPYALTGAIIAQDRSGDRLGARGRCASRPATSTSTTSRPARSSGSSRSAARRASGTNDKAGAPAEPDALDLAALDQGDVRPADGLPLPVHGPGLTPRRARPSPCLFPR